MWSSFHSLQISNAFVKLWHDFLDAADLEKQQLFVQHVSNKVFQQPIKKKFTVSQEAVSLVAPLTYEKVNALRYVAGYVCQKVKEKIEEAKHVYKAVFLLCLMDLYDEDEDVSESADWVHAVNRGGLHVCLIGESTAMLFHEIELVIRRFFHMTGMSEVTTDLRERVKGSVLIDEDVLFHWSILTTDIQDEKAKILLMMIVDLFITIRGLFCKVFYGVVQAKSKEIY